MLMSLRYRTNVLIELDFLNFDSLIKSIFSKQFKFSYHYNIIIQESANLSV